VRYDHHFWRDQQHADQQRIGYCPGFRASLIGDPLCSGGLVEAEAAQDGVNLAVDRKQLN
jgi:hypothetical protein